MPQQSELIDEMLGALDPMLLTRQEPVNGRIIQANGEIRTSNWQLTLAC